MNGLYGSLQVLTGYKRTVFIKNIYNIPYYKEVNCMGVYQERLYNRQTFLQFSGKFGGVQERFELFLFYS